MSYYIFDIPIYRCNEETHQKEYESIRQRKLQPFSKKDSPIAYAHMEKWIEEKYWYPWKFNEIIGYLRLFLHGHRIKGDLHWVKVKRIMRGPTKKIFYYSKVFEYTPKSSDSSQKIYKDLSRELRKFRVPIFHKSYMNFDEFMRFGKYIDWREMLYNG